MGLFEQFKDGGAETLGSRLGQAAEALRENVVAVKENTKALQAKTKALQDQTRALDAHTKALQRLTPGSLEAPTARVKDA